MSDESQIDIAQSFISLYVAPGASKPSAQRADIAQRYELCEDMANMLTQTAQDMLHSQTISEAAVLRNLLVVLSQPESVVSPREGQWVVRRLAELSDWPWPMGLDSESPVL